MNEKAEQTDRPQWIVIALAVASGVLAYRFSSFIIEISFFFFLYTLIPWKYYFSLIFGLFFAIICANAQHRILKDKSLGTNIVFLIVFIVLAVLPLRIGVAQRKVNGFANPISSMSKSKGSPVKLMCRIIDGDKIDEQIILSNEHVLNAEPYSWDRKSYQVQISLTREGQSILEKVTTDNIGKRFGFWIDNDLKSSPEIKASIAGGIITLPVDLDFKTAKCLAEGIMKGKSPDKK